MTTSTQPYTLGGAQPAGPLLVFPVFGPSPQLAYRSLATAIGLGAAVKELDAGASVGDLLVENPTDEPLLLFEGEEVLGAKQNRTFDSSVLVNARSRLKVPVSCVEQGRWTPGREADPMAPAPQAADPSLRRLKRDSANRSARAGLTARADQGAVWRAVGDRLADHGVDSSSAALNDVYDDRRGALLSVAEGVSHQPGQVGAVAAFAGKPQVLDLASRPEVFAELLPRLAQGYALDALSAQEGVAGRDQCAAFLRAAIDAPRADLATPGLGRGFGLAGAQLIGSGLEHQDELVQLSAFSAPDQRRASSASARATRIQRPSRRRG